MIKPQSKRLGEESDLRKDGMAKTIVCYAHPDGKYEIITDTERAAPHAIRGYVSALVRKTVDTEDEALAMLGKKVKTAEKSGWVRKE